LKSKTTRADAVTGSNMSNRGDYEITEVGTKRIKIPSTAHKPKTIGGSAGEDYWVNTKPSLCREHLEIHKIPIRQSNGQGPVLSYLSYHGYM